MTFGEALELCKKGARIARDGWNGKDQFVYYQSGSIVPAADIRNDALSAWAKEQGLSKVELWGHFDFKPTNNKIQCGWLASQSDMQADDWLVLPSVEQEQEQRSVSGILRLPAATMGGLAFSEQRVPATFNRSARGWWQSKDILFMSARAAGLAGQDTLTDYLNLEDIRAQLADLVGARRADVIVALPLNPAGGKTYHGVNCAYWLAGPTSDVLGCAAVAGLQVSINATAVLGCAPAFYVSERDQPC
jgi:hypothetical protein